MKNERNLPFMRQRVLLLAMKLIGKAILHVITRILVRGVLNESIDCKVSYLTLLYLDGSCDDLIVCSSTLLGDSVWHDRYALYRAYT